MDYFLRPMSSADAHAVVHWRYPGEYAFYNMDADPEDLREFLDFERWDPDTKFAVVDSGGDLVGFFEFTTRDGVMEVGLGMRPDLIGQGQGQRFLEAGLLFAVERFKPRWIKLAVATFNKRAITVYERVGFAVTNIMVQKTNGGAYEFAEIEVDPTRLRLFFHEGDKS
jgi:ribosomal-protein-alanine N-acetyltransferase